MAERFETRPDLLFDHVIHVVRDPDSTRRLFESELGIHTVAGGVHPAWGTWNALAYFGLTYIEWLGVRDAVTAESTEFGRNALNRLAIGEGAVQFALRTRNMDELARIWGENGLAFLGPVEASRNRPDGTTIRWRMLFPAQWEENHAESNQALLPFVIEWEEDDFERLTDLRKRGAVPPQDVLRLASVHLVTGNAEGWVHRYCSYFGHELLENGIDPHSSKSVHSWQTQIGTESGGILLHVLSASEAPIPLRDSQPRTPVGPFQLDLRRVGDAAVSCVPGAGSTWLAGLQVRIEDEDT